MAASVSGSAITAASPTGRPEPTTRRRERRPPIQRAPPRPTSKSGTLARYTSARPAYAGRATTHLLPAPVAPSAPLPDTETASRSSRHTSARTSARTSTTRLRVTGAREHHAEAARREPRGAPPNWRTAVASWRAAYGLTRQCLERAGQADGQVMFTHRGKPARTPAERMVGERGQISIRTPRAAGTGPLTVLTRDAGLKAVHRGDTVFRAGVSLSGPCTGFPSMTCSP